MHDAYKFAVYILFCSIFYCFLTSIKCHKLKNCTKEEPLACPTNSTCIPDVNSSELSCVCAKGYELNNFIGANRSELIESSSEYCIPVAKQTIVYVLAPPKIENLAIAISLVLLLAIAATAFLYFLKVLRPINRTKAAYVRLQRSHNRHRRLQEFDEIDLTFRDTSNVPEIS